MPRASTLLWKVGLNSDARLVFATASGIGSFTLLIFGRDLTSSSVRIDVDALLNPDAHPGPEFVEVEYPELKRAHEESEDEIEGEPVKKKRAIGVSSAQQAPRARARYPPAEAPCCLCASSSTDGLLPVHDPPQTTSAILPTMTQDEHGSTVELWRAHEHCARIIPETWVDEVDGRKVVFGVDGIPKDRWNLVSLPNCVAASAY